MGDTVNYKKLAIKELRTYKDLEKSIRLGEKRIKDIEQSGSGKSYSMGLGIQRSNDNNTEDYIIALIEEKENTAQHIAVNKLKLSVIQAVLHEMTEEEIKILKMFYIERKRYHYVQLEQELYCSHSHVYNKRNAALKKYILLRFGVEQ